MDSLRQTVTDALTVSPERWPTFISGLGVVLGLIHALELVLVGFMAFPTPDGYFAGVITSVPIIGGLIYGGYWLTESRISPQRYGRLAGWCMLGLAGFTGLILGITAAAGPVGTVGYISTFRWAASTGGGIGFLIGMFNARALDRAFEAGQIRASKEKLHQELELYEALFDAVPEPVVRVRFDDENRPIVREVNSAFEDVFGYEEAELKGRDIDEFIIPERFADEAGEIGDMTASGAVIHREVRRQTATDEQEFLFRAKPLESPDESAEAIGIYVDLAEQKERERKLERYETIIEAIGDPVYTLDADGNYTFVNEAFIEQTGYPREEVIGEHASKVVPEASLEIGRSIIRELLADETRQTATWELKRLTADGELVPAENHVALLPPKDGEFQGSAGVIRDITARKQRQQELKRQNERLEEFASVVSHDLRNPLNVAEGRLALAIEDCDSEHLEAIDRALDRMKTLIEDMLSLAKAGEAVRESQSVALSDLLADCWRNVETGSGRLVTDTEGTIEADRTRLRQLLENLFRNAIEHGSDDVTVTVGDLPNGFYVEDDGPGIPVDAREDVLKPGYSTTQDGTGFGLGIVRDIADAHGWDFDIATGAGGGARFEFTGVERNG